MASTPTRLSDLPFDILQIICKKLGYVKDYVFFGAVCSLWRSVLFQCRQHIPPVLMTPTTLPVNYRHGHVFRHTVFNFPDFREHVNVLSSKMYSTVYGSSHGWLITRGPCIYNDTLQLLNPFSSVNIIKLPFTNSEPFKAVLSHDPLKTSNYVVIIIDRLYKLSFFKAGDTSWTRVDYYSGFQDITYYRDQIYAISCWGELVSCDICSTPMSVKKVASVWLKDYYMRLAVSAGNLFCVDWKRNGYGKTVTFRLFKVETSNGELLEVNNLEGDAIIFLNRSTCVSVSASDIPNCKPDCIYFSTSPFIQVFTLIDKKIQYLDVPAPHTILPVCIQPTLNMNMTTRRT